jgi:hypothetical protein
MRNPKIEPPLALQLERALMVQYGPLVSNDALRIVLGYPSKAAFRQALSRKTVPVPVFTLTQRRGKFALVRDVAAWLATERERAIYLADSNP